MDEPRERFRRRGTDSGGGVAELGSRGRWLARCRVVGPLRVHGKSDQLRRHVRQQVNGRLGAGIGTGCSGV
uniref:Uncharacterized protein n=1 Tax=uncultured marine virus TaxID=186617 RepID=A0A0F7L7A0_9VIRU|nr:hypothetical protein [uncultured marine virus]